MSYVDAAINAVMELFKWLNKKDAKDDADTDKVNANPRPPRPQPPAPKPPDTPSVTTKKGDTRGTN